MTDTAPLGVITIPAFKDNYFWLVHNGTVAIIIDPGEASIVQAALEQYKLKLIAILVTHHHADHIGGVEELKQAFKVPVFGPRSEHIPSVSHPVQHNGIIKIEAMALEFTVLEIPGHTLDHVAYVATTHGWLFCGDTLFGAGCGRVFEGTPAQMYASLQLLASMPDTTMFFCAHEYTLSNLRFAHKVEPRNMLLTARIKVDTEKRAENLPSIPGKLGLEKRTNPFLRCTEKEVIRSLLKYKKLTPTEDGQYDEVAVFTALREWKNTFK